MKNQRKNVAVMMSSTDIDSEMRFLKGVCDCAFSNNIDVSVFMALGGYDMEKRHNTGEYNIYNLPDLSRFDGVILIPNLISSVATRAAVLEKIRESGTPCVSIDYQAEGFYNVKTDNRFPVRQIVEHLITVHGLRRIDFVTGPAGNTEIRERFLGYCDALKNHHIPIEPDRIFEGSFTMLGGIESVRTILHQAESGRCSLPEAIVFANDASAVHGTAELIRNGLRVPEDILVTGYDDTEQARNFSPRLTSVFRPLETIAYHACEKILRIISGIPTSREESFTAYPVFRESCGCPSCEEESYAQFRFRQFETAAASRRDATQIPQLSMDLYECDDFPSYYKKLEGYAARLDCDGFYLCLDPSLNNSLMNNDFPINGYRKRMTVPIAMQNGQSLSCPDFFTDELFPCSPPASSAPSLYLFLPLHYQEFTFGYLMLVNSYVPFYNRHFNSWLMTVSNSLENLRRHELLKTMVADLDSKYVQDSLTGLYNRFGFTRHARLASEQSFVKGQSLAILFFDLDSLKYINDHFGHEEGDFALVQFSRALEKIFCSNETICRFGGDEFVVLATDCTRETLLDHIRALDLHLESLSCEQRLPYAIQTSSGFYLRQSGDNCTVEECVMKADKEMYSQKRKKHQQRT